MIEGPRDDAVKGVALVYLGVGVVFTDLRIITSAFIIGNGCRLIAKSASPLVRVVTILPPVHTAEITIREGGGVSRT
jgi:hypothetical protein